MICSMMTLKRGGISLLAPLMMLAVSAAVAVPSNFTISGVLKDANGQLLPDASGVATQVVFYAGETAETSLETVTTSCRVRNGLFNARIYFPISLLSQDELWYTLALDTDGNGLDANDVFAERFYISAVPFSINSQPATLFSTHGGWIDDGSSWGTVTNRVELSPFTTPSGGTVFDVLVFRIGGSGPRTLNIAIYDDNGSKLLASEPLIASYETGVPFPNYNTYALPLEGTLEPSKVYYVAFVTATPGTGVFSTQQIIWPYGGNQEIFTSNATLPETIDLQSAKLGVGFNLTLIKTDEEKVGGALSPCIGTSKEGLPIYAPLAPEEPRR